MKKPVISLIIFLCAIALGYKSHASHAAGGELLYEWISGSTYKIIFKFYRDCDGQGEPATQNVCYKNSCNSVAGTILLNKVSSLPGSAPNGAPVSPGCPGVGTTCTGGSSTIPGYREWWYEGTITLPSQCDFWTFSTSIFARNPSMNLSGASGTYLYIEATLNNLIAQGNNSPYFSVKPVPYVCISQPYTFNNGAVDANNDSLTFEVLNPLTSVCSGPASNVPLAFKTPSLSIPSNPFQTNNTFSINNSTGELSFTPGEQGPQTVTIKVNEYRYGILIGSVMRDVQVQVLNCTNVPPTVVVDQSSINGGIYINNRTEGCATQPLSFCFNVKSAKPTAVLVTSDNHSSAAPGATVTYTNLFTDSVRGCLSWTPGPADTGLKVFTVVVKDSACEPPGILFTQTFTVPFYIWPRTRAFKDTTICAGDNVTLNAAGGAGFVWSVMPGGAPVSSLSCTSCKNPVATPTTTTSYIVTATLGNTLCSNKDTITITVNNPQPPPASNNSPVCVGGSVTLTAGTPTGGATGYYWTGPGFTSTQKSPAISNIQLTNAGVYSVRSIIGVCTSAVANTTVIVNTVPPPPVISGNSPICDGGTINLTATSTFPGATFNWSGPSFTSTVQNPSIPNATTAASGVYSAFVTIPGCPPSPPANINVIVNPLPAAPVVSNVTYCQNGTAAPLTATGTGLLWYTTPAGGTGSTAAPIPSTTTPGTTTWYVSQTVNGCEGPRAAIDVIVKPKPAPPVTAPVTYCQNDAATALTATGTGLLWYTSATGGTGSSTAPVPPTGTAGVTNWYVSQTVNGCESDRAPLAVTIIATPPAPTVTPAQYCQDEPATPALGTFVSGTNVLWYTTATGGTGSATPPVVNTAVAGTTTYYVSHTPGQCESFRTPIPVTVHPTPPLPQVSDISYCQTESAVPLTATGQNLLWYTSATGGFGSMTPPVPVTGTPGVISYYVTQTINGCESDRAKTDVTIKPKPGQASGPSPTYCQFDTPTPLAATGQNILWYTTATGGTGSTTAPTPSTATPGTTSYYVTQTIDGCESDRYKIDVEVKEKPVPPVTEPVEYCLNSSAVPLAANAQGYLKWYTTLTGGTGTTTAPMPSTAFVGVTNYYVSQTVNGCESDRALLPVKVDTVVTANIILSKDPLCQYDSVIISHVGIIPSSGNFIWDFDGGTVSWGTGSGPYNVKWNTTGIKNIELNASIPGCRAEDSRQLNILPAPEAGFEMPDEACIGKPVNIEANSNLSLTAAYMWDFGSGDTVEGSHNKYSISWAQSGMKTVLLHTMSAAGCISLPYYDSIYIRENPLAQIQNVSSRDICGGDTISLAAKVIPSYIYYWTPEKYILSNNQSDAQASFINSTSIVLTVTDTVGCEATDSVFIQTHPCCDLFLPNAFTPNRDGKNDVFRVITNGNHKLQSFIIVNRFGEVVFETRDQSVGWDGNYKGIPADLGTYFYYLKYDCVNGETLEKKGDIILIR